MIDLSEMTLKAARIDSFGKWALCMPLWAKIIWAALLMLLGGQSLLSVS